MRQLLDFALLSNKEYQSQQAAGYSLSVKNGKFLSTVKNRNQDFRSVKLGETPKDAGYAPSLSNQKQKPPEGVEPSTLSLQN